ncbi:MAG: S1 family peptidase [Actinomycetota bacterium]
MPVGARPLLAAVLVLIALVLVAGCLADREAGVAVTGPPTAEAALSDGVMLIKSTACGENTRCGTAFTAEIDGRLVLLTNRHVVEAGCSTTAQPWSGGADLPVREVWLARDADVAVLLLDEGDLPPPLPVDVGVQLTPGQPIRVVGFPEAEPTVLAGHVQRIEQQQLVLAIDAGQGASGSPVIDADGRVVGQLYARARDDEECCIATPIAQAVAAAEDAEPAVVCP